MTDEEFDKWLEEYQRRQKEIEAYEAKTAMLEVIVLAVMAVTMLGFAVMSCGG